ncbi:hypothetical protein [Pseudomonas sp. ML96]|uniref:hypothetical protein n=1 Tax=Pseudomonas sp. ML96 TaxID=1523503 RepID=UPI0005B7F7FD|nr:hypothetical protein [Pseudomonas sp. ML96]
MALNLFVDNDVILKLAQYGVLERLPELFSNQDEPVQLIVLDSAKYKLLPKRNRLELCGTEGVALQVEHFLDVATKLSPDAVDLDTLEIFNAAPGIDVGEALLFAAAAGDDNGRVLTGDKRALSSLLLQDSVQLTTWLTNKLITLEALIQGFAALDLPAIQHTVRANAGVDKALTNVFGVSAPASADSVRAGLNSYVEHLRKQLGGLINSGPPFT